MVASKLQPLEDSSEHHSRNPITLAHQVTHRLEVSSEVTLNLKIRCLANSKLSQMGVFLELAKTSNKHLDSSTPTLNNSNKEEVCLDNNSNKLGGSLEAARIKEELEDFSEDSNSNNNHKMLEDYSEEDNSQIMVL